MLEISSNQKNVCGKSEPAKRSLAASTILESKLYELRKELSSDHGGIFPHSVLSTQHISMVSAEKPSSVEEVRLFFALAITLMYILMLVFVAIRTLSLYI